MTSCGCGCCSGIQVETPVPVTNPPGLPAIARRVGDHRGFFSSMRARLSSPAYPALSSFTVRDTDDPAIALLDGWAAVADVLTFYTERLANEGYLRTATQDQSLRLLGRLVGYRPRPGVAADTYLSYTLDKDPAGRDTTVTIGRGARAQSVPAPGQDAQSFESSDDLLARWSWNDLQVRMRRPVQITPADLPALPQVNLAGTGTALTPGNRLLFVFGEEPGEQNLFTISQVAIDRAADVTVVSQAAHAAPSLDEVKDAYTTLLEDPAIDLETMYGRSRIVRRFADEWLLPLEGQLGSITTVAGFADLLDQLLQRLDETAGLAAAYPAIHDWFTTTLGPALAAVRAQLARLEPLPGATGAAAPGGALALARGARQPLGESQPLFTALGLDRAGGAGTGGHGGDERGQIPADPALLALAAVIGSLRRPPSRPPASSAALIRDPAALYAPGSDTGARLLAALDPRIRDMLYTAWGTADVTQPRATQEVQALRVTASPFGATAPLRPLTDDQGHVTGHTEWPLGGDLSVQVTYDTTTGTTPITASLTLTAAAGLTNLTLTAGQTTDHAFGPGHVQITVTAALVTFVFSGDIPNRTVTIVNPSTSSGSINVTVQDGGDPLTLSLTAPAAGGSTTATGTQADAQVTATRGPSGIEIGGPMVSVYLHTVADPNVLDLDAVYDGIAPGMWVAVERPRKGAAGPGGIPGDPSLALVVTRAKDARVISRAGYGITAKVTSLTLERPWLDEQDTLLSDIRDATVYTRGEPVQLATEPITDDVAGDQIELAQAYDGLTPGRWVVVAGERTDVPGATGVPGAELSMIAAVRQTVDPARPGDAVHAVITLAVPLSYRYKRATAHVYANVVHATQGATRDEAIGSGDASRAGQTFTLFQGPLTWLAAANPLGAASTLEVRVGGVLWQEVDSFAGRGPAEQVYVTSAGDDGRVRVTFGDGVHGARLPTGQENVRAHYRFGIGSGGDLPAGQISQLTTRPLGVSGVINPLPAVGGADADDAAQTRRGIPLSLTALDRLVGVPDYENFARARAGIGRASARRLFDGSREVVHVTVAGAGDIPLTNDSDLLAGLRAALAAFGDPQLPVAVAVREAVLLLVAASVRVDAAHTWELVEPQVRAALTGRLGFGAREIGQPAYLSEVISTVQAVPGVDYVDVTAFTGVPGSATPAALQNLAAALATPLEVVPASLARFDVTRYTVTDPGGETLTGIAAANGITVAELLALNPDLTDVTPLPQGRSVVVFRGIRPAQLVMVSAAVPETLILTEAPS
jgi:predicted phage baseplate assembly protein